MSRGYHPDPNRDYPPHNDPSTLGAWARTIAAEVAPACKRGAQ